MAHKRPFEDQLVNEVPSKHPRHTEEGFHNVSHLEIVSLEQASGKPYPAGEGSFVENGLERQDINSDGCMTGFPDNIVDSDARASGSITLSPCAASNSNQEDDIHDLVVQLPFTTKHFSFDGAVSYPVHADDLYSKLLDYPPRKSVPIGPEHQADIPELSNSSPIRDENDELAGICVIPRINSELPPYNGDGVGPSRTDCNCADMGFVRCVRQHILEAREKLMTTLGEEAFVELGFCEMGEVVTEKWSEDEEQLFHKVVYCNPVSSGKNFWNILSAVLPSHTKMEIVSYYFNVFMLQKRAEQNRRDPMNIDSDNDEWELSDDDDGYDASERTDEEDDSAVESPDSHPNSSSVHIDNENPFDDFGFNRDFNSKFACNSGIELLEKRHYYDPVDNDFHDGSCTSSDSGASVQIPQENPGCNEEWPDFILEPCDAKVWDVYSGHPKDGVDFLPTCSVIEEVFGDGTVDSQAKHL